MVLVARILECLQYRVVYCIFGDPPEGKKEVCCLPLGAAIIAFVCWVLKSALKNFFVQVKSSTFLLECLSVVVTW